METSRARTGRSRQRPTHREQAAAAYAGGATLEQAKKRVSDYLISKYATKFDPKFPQSVGSNVIKAYQVIVFAP
jgi:hypothetical protein